MEVERAAKLPVPMVAGRHDSVNVRGIRRLLRDRIGTLSTLFVFAVVIAGFLAPVLAPYDPIKLDLKQALKSPTPAHLLGTDELGRDIFSRILYGAGISIRSVIVVIVLSLSIGIVLGTLAGYVGGFADDLIMRVSDIFLALPSVILAMAFAAALGPSQTNAAISLGLVWWPSYARMVRGQVLATRGMAFVEAARSIGAGHVRLIMRHLLPNCLDPIIVRIPMTAGYVILMMAGLSFIGLGAQPPEPEWGLMIANARRYLFNAPWYPTLVGVAIFVTVLSTTIATDAIQDAFEPRLVSDD